MNVLGIFSIQSEFLVKKSTILFEIKVKYLKNPVISYRDYFWYKILCQACFEPDTLIFESS